MSNYRTIDKATGLFFDKVITKLNHELVITPCLETIGVNLVSKFESLKQYNHLYVHKVTEFSNKKSTFVLLLMEAESSIINYRQMGNHIRQYETQIEELEPILFFNLPHDIGRIFISQESWADKVVDLLIKADVDFPDFPKFSSTYNVMAENPELVKDQFPRKILAALEGTTDLIIEINEGIGLLRKKRY